MSQKLLPQRHRDTEENQIEGFASAINSELFGGQFKGLCLSLCLCVSVVQKGFLS
jgi:hypothetical protein